jgi:hypothetical protein
MSEEFEQWWVDDNNTLIKNPSICTHYDLAKLAWNHQQAKIDAQAKELEALRGFATDVITDWQYNKSTIDDISETAKAYALIDADGKPTPLLTGEKE